MAGLLAALALAGCGETGGGTASRAGAKAPGAIAAVVGPRATSLARNGIREVADPEEARSYPESGPVHHASATTPASAGEVAARGAASTAEVRAELALLNEVEHNATKTELHNPRSGRAVDRRQRHHPDPDRRTGSCPEGDRRRQ